MPITGSDVMCGPALAARARAKGLVYSMAYGDQPALICELVDRAGDQRQRPVRRLEQKPSDLNLRGFPDAGEM